MSGSVTHDEMRLVMVTVRSRLVGPGSVVGWPRNRLLARCRRKGARSARGRTSLSGCRCAIVSRIIQTSQPSLNGPHKAERAHT